MNLKRRYEAIRAMETLARGVNDENVFEIWLMLGVADGDIDDSTDDNELDFYAGDENFAELMHTFLSVMARAKKSGGLYIDGIVDKSY